MSPRAQVYFLALILILSGLALVVYKNQGLGLPIWPGKYDTVWTVEAKIEFDALGDAVKTSLALPKGQNQIEVLDEVFSSSGYGFNLEKEGQHSRAVWTKRTAFGPQTLYYKLALHQQGQQKIVVDHQPPAEIASPDWSGSGYDLLRSAAESLIEDSTQRSADMASFATLLLSSLNDQNNRDSQVIFSSLSDQQYIDITLDLFAFAGVPARIIRGIFLEDDRARIGTTPLIEIYDGSQWLVFSPRTAAKGLPNNFLIWQRGDKSLLDVEGGKRSRVRFSVLSNDVPARTVAIDIAGQEKVALVDYSIYSLPIEQQSIFKFILLVPLGAVIVIFLRVVIGIRTAGTFMPVLLAIAFIQTSLINGVLIFLLILGVGLFVRSYLSRLDLLLIARIAAVVVIVVGMMAALSIVSYKLGLEQALTVTFFPMIIIAWTIEHMSILWEDDGPIEVMIQTAGSLLVAVLCYWVMTNRFSEHWMFNFPELLLVLLGVIIMLGHYTGYRLSELLRFRYMEPK